MQLSARPHLAHPTVTSPTRRDDNRNTQGHVSSERAHRPNRTRTQPHTATAERRHSFAVHMLGLLLRQTVRALGAEVDGRLTGVQVKRLLVGNPMRKLQLLLGHSQESTVYTYLDVLDEAQEIVLSALEEWDVQAGVLDVVAIDDDADGDADDATAAGGVA